MALRGWTIPHSMPKSPRRIVRGKIGRRPLDAVLTADIASDDLIEVKGWVLPAALAQLCALAAIAN